MQKQKLSIDNNNSVCVEDYRDKHTKIDKVLSAFIKNLTADFQIDIKNVWCSFICKAKLVEGKGGLVVVWIMEKDLKRAYWGDERLKEPSAFQKSASYDVIFRPHNIFCDRNIRGT